jgi:hypothetical protein
VELAGCVQWPGLDLLCAVTEPKGSSSIPIFIRSITIQLRASMVSKEQSFTAMPVQKHENSVTDPPRRTTSQLPKAFSTPSLLPSRTNHVT